MPRRQPSKKNISQKVTSEDGKCLFCARGPDHDNLAVGPIYSKDGIFAHKNCLYFGAGLAQQEDVDTDSEGVDELFFFQIDAIKKEARRSSKLKCDYCKLPNASAGCVNKKCKKKFHFPCGIESGVMFNFRDFSSACPEHREKQEPHSTSVELICHICQEDVENGPSFDQIYCPSCKRWLHRRCLQLWAYKAGVHHLRCPMCNNGEQFKEELCRLGFEIPDRDAEWEREGMYREQEEGVFMKCSAEECVCPHSRDYSAKKGLQELIACVVCGEFAIHRQCIDNYSLSLSNDSVDIWWCDLCERVELKLEAQKQIAALYKERAESKITAFHTSSKQQVAVEWDSDSELESFIHFEMQTINANSEAMPPASKKAKTSVNVVLPSSSPLVPPLRSPPTASTSLPPKPSVQPPKSSGKKSASKRQDHFLSPTSTSTVPSPKKSMSSSKKQSTTLAVSNSAPSSVLTQQPPIKSPTYTARIIPASHSEKPVFPLFQQKKEPTSESKSGKSALGQSSNRLSPPLLPVPISVQTLLLD